MTRKMSFAKTSRPQLFSVVARERLFLFLDENRGRPLIWVSGPPGAGKTTVVASYVESREVPVLWYQVDPGDDDPAAIFFYLSAAAETVLDADMAPLPKFLPEHFSDLQGFSRRFFRALFTRLPGGSMLVLDNYQEAPPDAALHAIVQQCVDEVPPELSVVGISRSEAPQHFIRHAATSSMTVLGSEQLKLTLEEVRAVAAKRNIRDDWLVNALHQQSQGWAAGVTLMQERLGNLDDSAHELPSETRESVFNYFSSLIFDQATDVVQHTLLSLAFLPSITPSLARTVSGNSEAPALVEELYRQRMFTERKPGAGSVYQFHALFVEFLRGRARQTFASKEFNSLLHSTARALEQAGDIEAAIEIWSEACKWEEASRLILKSAKQILAAGRRQTLIRWIEKIPISVRSTTPRLLLWLGRAQLQTSPELGSTSLAQSVDIFRGSDDRSGHVEALGALLVGAFVGFRDLKSMDKWLNELLSQIKHHSDFESSDQELWVWGVLCVTLFHIRPWHELTVLAYRRVAALLPRCQDPGIALIAATNALVVSGLCGDFETGDRITQTTESVALQDSASPSDAAWWFAQVGWLRFMQARYDEALVSLEQGCRIAKSNELHKIFRNLLSWRYNIEWRVVGWSSANATMAEIDAIPEPRQPMSEAQYCLFESRQLVHLAQMEDAASLAMRSHEAANRVGSCLEEVVFSLCNADVLAATGHTDNAKRLLQQASRLIDRAPVYGCWSATTLFMEAWIAYADNDENLTLNLLRRSLALARTDRQCYYLRFSDSAMQPLFRLALVQGIEVDLVRDLIRMFRVRPPPDTPANWPWTVQVVTLGRFEIRSNGEPVEFSRKLPRKTLLLLKAIVAFGGQEVPEQMLCDALWGDEDGDAARNALSITVLRLRKLLGTIDAVSQHGGKISLNPECCWVDAAVFEAGLQTAGSASDRTLNLYGGSFLPEDLDESWSVAARERLRGKYIDALSGHGKKLESESNLHEAIQCYLRGIDADQIIESFHQGLMRCYENQGRRSEAFSVYRRLRHTLSVVLGVPPSDDTNQLFHEMLERQSAEGALASLSGIDASNISKLPQKPSAGH